MPRPKLKLMQSTRKQRRKQESKERLRMLRPPESKLLKMPRSRRREIIFRLLKIRENG